MRGAEDLGVGKVNRGTNSEVRETVFEAIDERTICVRIFMSVIDLAEVEIDGDLTCMPRMRWKCGHLLGLHINYTLLVLEISLIIYIFWDWKSVAASDRHEQMHFLFVLLWLLCCKFLALPAMFASFHLETLGVIHEAIYYKILLPPLYIKSFICVYLIFFPSFSYVFVCVRIDFILF